jgi:hypothetical protein
MDITTAKALGLDIPPTMLALADPVNVTHPNLVRRLASDIPLKNIKRVIRLGLWGTCV